VWWASLRIDAPDEPLALAAGWLTAMVLPLACGGFILYVLWRRWERAAT
jgi:hypothetical protein